MRLITYCRFSHCQSMAHKWLRYTKILNFLLRLQWLIVLTYFRIKIHNWIFKVTRCTSSNKIPKGSHDQQFSRQELNVSIKKVPNFIGWNIAHNILCAIKKILFNLFIKLMANNLTSLTVTIVRRWQVLCMPFTLFYIYNNSRVILAFWIINNI